MHSRPCHMQINYFTFIFLPTVYLIANSVRIVFSDNGTDRTLKIGEGVQTTLNCSLVAFSLQDQAVAPQSIATNWILRKFIRQNILS